MKLNELKIDPELRDLLPPLTADEYSQLEKNVLRDGKLTQAIWTWNGFIVDGHNRHKICTEHKINVPEDYIIALAYETKAEIFQWMIDTQLGRRNLTPIQKIAIAEKYRPIYEAKARENQLSGLKQNNTVLMDSSKRDEPINTRQKLADIAGVSEDTYAKGAKILNSDNDTLKQEVISGQKSINSGYNELTGKAPKPKVAPQLTITPQTKICTTCGAEKPNIDFYGDDKICKGCVLKASEENTSPTQTGGLFKDITGNPLPYDKNDTESIKAAIKEVRTEKDAVECTTGKGEINWTNSMCDDLIEQLCDHYFGTLHSTDKMTRDEKKTIADILNETINKLSGIKTKLEMETK